MTWKAFCRALSAAGVPECGEPMGHGGAHIFAHMDMEILIDRCATMLKEQRETLFKVQAGLEEMNRTLQQTPDGFEDLRAAVDAALSLKREG